MLLAAVVLLAVLLAGGSSHAMLASARSLVLFAGYFLTFFAFHLKLYTASGLTKTLYLLHGTITPTFDVCSVLFHLNPS